MTKTEATWLARNIRCAPEERIRIWELRGSSRGMLLARDNAGRPRTWAVRASSCYKRMVQIWAMRGVTYER